VVFEMTFDEIKKARAAITGDNWHADPETGFSYVYGWVHGRHRIADTGPTRDYSFGKTSCGANTHFIAKSPEYVDWLVERLETAIKLWDHRYDSETLCTDPSECHKCEFLESLNRKTKETNDKT